MNDPFALNSLKNLPRPELFWEQTSVFISGLIANRLTFELVKINSWLPSAKEEDSDEISKLISDFDDKYKVLVNEFSSYKFNDHYLEKCLAYWNKCFNFRDRLVGLLGLDCTEYQADLWNETIEIAKDEFLSKEFIIESISQSTSCVVFVLNEIKNCCDKKAYYIFMLGILCDYLVYTYREFEGSQVVDHSLKINETSGEKIFENSKGSPRFSFSISLIPDFFDEDFLHSEQLSFLSEEIKAIKYWRIARKSPTPDEYYKNLNAIYEKLLALDYEEYRKKYGVRICENELHVGPYVFKFSKSRKVYEMVIEYFIENKIFDEEKAVTSIELARALKIRNGGDKISADDIFPKERLSKCEKPWANFFKFNSKSGSPKYTDNVGSYLQVNHPYFFDTI